MDLISREDAIRWVKTECNPYGKPTLDFESGKKVIEHLEQMPSIIFLTKKIIQEVRIMELYTQDELKELVQDGLATDITSYDLETMNDFLNSHALARIGISVGKYGMNGGLLRDVLTGEKFVIHARTTALFMTF